MDFKIMPPRRYRKKRNYKKRRPYKKRSKYSRQKVTTGRGFGRTGLPDRMFVKLTYAETIRLTSGSQFDNHVFSGNSINDPNTSGVGHQPKGMDQWGQFYSRYMVHASKITCRFTPTNSNATGNQNIYLLPTLDSLTLPGWTSIQEDKFGKASIVGPYVGQGIRYLKDYMSTKKLYGDVNGLEQNDYGASFSFDPPRPWFWIVGAETQDGSALANCDVAVVITYYVELYQRIDLPQS